MRYPVPLALAVLILPGLVQAGDLPKRKPGLWEIKIVSDTGRGEEPLVSQHCIDEKTDHLMPQQAQGMMKAECRKETVRNEGGKTIAESVCVFGGTTTTTKAIFSGDFSSNYRGDIHSTYSPPMMGMKEARSTLEAKWLGACKPGLKPGDVIMPGGVKFNMFDLDETMRNRPKR